jgi:membrane-bound lytic murein transglycosylase B
MHMTLRIHRLRTIAILGVVALGAACSASAWAQSDVQARQSVQEHHLRSQLQGSALREQQRQQTSRTVQQAFKDTATKSGVLQADQAQYDAYRANQRNRVDDAAAHPVQQRAVKLKPLHPASARSGS